MSRLGRAAMLLLIGVSVGRLVIDGGFGWFVQQHMRIPLGLAAGLLVVFGAYELQASVRRRGDPRRAAGPGIGWLLVLPLLVLFAVAPSALGASAADRIDAFVPTEAPGEFSPISSTETPSGESAPSDVIETDADVEMLQTTSAEPVELSIREFLDRAIWDVDRSLENQVVTLEGMVVNAPDVDDGFKLTRFLVSCCAADGIPLQVDVHGVDEQFADDTWVTVDLVWSPPEVSFLEQSGEWIVDADAISVTPLDEVPQNPYESPY